MEELELLHIMNENMHAVGSSCCYGHWIEDYLMNIIEAKETQTINRIMMSGIRACSEQDGTPACDDISILVMVTKQLDKTLPQFEVHYIDL
ncbi:hypothetical protein FRX31_018569 [Thalictrum thalictroides]|uniref:Uncharacterized protein n=1 Tax=Thalictrum thalictroides TaxID=46969 RepID=A0A7J6W394_THATH|nr:hypothetical protein FRX31_018569 [Thalictrum thalictroides]